MAKKYFLYSPSQVKLRREVEAKMGKRYYVGYVFINGKRKPFTELSSTKTSRYSDTIVVAEMDDSQNIKYEMPGGR